MNHEYTIDILPEALPDDLKAHTTWYFVVRYCFTHSSRMLPRSPVWNIPGLRHPVQILRWRLICKQDVSKSWGSRWRFREKGWTRHFSDPSWKHLVWNIPWNMTNIYVIQSLRRKLRRHFQLGKQLFYTHPRLARVISIGKELLDALLEHSELRTFSVSCCLMLPPVCNPGCQSCSYLFVTYWMAQPRKGPKAFRKGKKNAHLYHMEPRAWKVHHFSMFFPYFSVSLFGEHTFCKFVPYIFPEGATPQPANDRIQGMSHNFHELQIAMAVWLE